MRQSDFVEVAARDNHGVLSWRLADEHGISRSTWCRWMRQGLGQDLGYGVRVLVDRAGAEASLRATLDVLGPGALLARRSALWAMGIARHPRPLEVVIAERRLARTLPGVRVIRSRTLREVDPATFAGWPCTSPARTLLDLAVSADEDVVLALLLDLLFAELVTVEAVRVRLGLTPTAWGRAQVLRVISRLGSSRPDSIFEWWVAERLIRHGLHPSRQPVAIDTPDGRHEADILVDNKVLVECHGGHHRTPEQLARDLAKANALSLAGYLVLAVDFPTFRRDPNAFARLVVRACADRAPHP